jgi:hypothetical protein
MPLIKICQSYYERNVIKERLCIDILLLISSDKQLSYEIKIVAENACRTFYYIHIYYGLSVYGTITLFFFS